MLELDLQQKTFMARSIMTEYFGANAGIELAALQKNCDEAQTRSVLRTRMSAAHRSAVEERDEN